MYKRLSRKANKIYNNKQMLIFMEELENIGNSAEIFKRIDIKKKLLLEENKKIVKEEEEFYYDDREIKEILKRILAALQYEDIFVAKEYIKLELATMSENEKDT